MRTVLLLLVAFLAGAILMALELVGSRVLAPFFGGSIFVWGSLIGVFLGAMSLGYYIGGRLVDRWPSAGLLSGFILLAGLFVLLLPRYGDVISDRILLADYGNRMSPLLACTVLFFIPGMLMAVTSPFVIRLTAQTIDRVGRTAGVVYAISTVGSIAGTLGTAFYLIPAWGTRALLHVIGFALVGTAAIALAAGRQRLRAGPAGAVLALLLLGAPADAKETVLLERDSAYHRLFVTEEGHYRWLRADNIWHTQMDLRDPQGRGLPYADYIDLAFVFNRDIRKVLVIGLGGGTVPKRFVRDYPNVVVDAVEIDPAVITIAKRYFYVSEGPRLRIHEADGRQFLRRSKEKWDLILLDAYYADTVPFFLTTKEFFLIVKEHLTPNGMLVNNVVGRATGPRSKFFRSVYKTMDDVFPQLHGFEVKYEDTTWVNIEVFALNSARTVPLSEIRTRAKELQGKLIKDDRLLERVDDYVRGPIRTGDVPLLTDDYAPVDGLMHLW
jgi:spermidine synthase